MTRRRFERALLIATISNDFDGKATVEQLAWTLDDSEAIIELDLQALRREGFAFMHTDKKKRQQWTLEYVKPEQPSPYSEAAG